MFSASASSSALTTKLQDQIEYCAFFNETKHLEYNFLSNFYLRPIPTEFGVFRCSEGFYQFQKFAHLKDEDIKKRFLSADGQTAYDLSRKLADKIDSQWNKEAAMYIALKAKFNDLDMKHRLLSTGSAYLVENSPNGHDAFWADNGDGKGLNKLGHILMNLRQDLGGHGVVPRPPILDLFYSRKCDLCTNCSHFTNNKMFYNYCDTHMLHELKLGNFVKSIHLSDIPDGTGRFLYFKTSDIPELVEEGSRLIADRIHELGLENPFFITPEASTITIAHNLRTKYNIDGIVIGKSKKPTDVETFKVDYCAITSTEKKSLYINKEEVEKLNGKNIIIFDNVCTTGETLRAVYELLLKAGVNCEKIKEAIVLFTEGNDASEIPISDNKSLPLHRFCHLPLFPVDPSVDKSIYRLYSAATLPTLYGLHNLAVYHDRTGSNEKDAIAFYPVNTFEKGRNNVPVRVHDACATSELFDSVKCDCKLQLDQAKKYIAEHGGIIIYLNQEGRGIGLGNKIAAYNLQQEKGLDTVAANRELGLPDDIRHYEAVRDILKNLGVESIQLISNNPRKRECLEKLGVKVTGNIPCLVQATHAPMQHYMQTKALAMGHQIPKSNENKQEIIFVMGGPGSGKGTHCKSLANKKGYHHISTGDLIRGMLSNPSQYDQHLLAEMKPIVERGDLLDDALTLRILKAEMEMHPYACGFLIDGYPRTLGQATLFEKTIRPCDKVIYFNVSDEAMEKRILQRNLTQHRSDDIPQTIQHRLAIYHQQTVPVIRYLQEKYPQQFIEIDTSGSIAEVDKAVQQHFKNFPAADPSVVSMSVFAKKPVQPAVNPNQHLINRRTYQI